MRASRNSAPTVIPVAIRIYPEPPKDARGRNNTKADRPDTMIVFDTETTTDPTQRLLFGCYRFLENGICTKEGLFHAADLSADQLKTLRQYAARNPADTEGRGSLEFIDVGKSSSASSLVRPIREDPWLWASISPFRSLAARVQCDPCSSRVRRRILARIVDLYRQIGRSPT